MEVKKGNSEIKAYLIKEVKDFQSIKVLKFYIKKDTLGNEKLVYF